MHRDPYRATAPQPDEDHPTAPPREEVVCYGVLASVGVLPVWGAVVDHASFHTEATIGLFMLVAGVLGLVASARAAWIARRARRGDRVLTLS